MNRKLLISLSLAFFLAPLGAQESKENADFKLAMNLYNDRFYDLALEQFRQFVSFYPNTQQGIEARYYFGLTQFELELYDDARLTFQNFALAYPGHPNAPNAWEKVAQAYAEEGNSREAALAYERIRTFHPRSILAPVALRKSAELFDALGDSTQTVRILKTLTQEYSGPEVLAANLRLAELFAADGQTDAAMNEVRKVIDGSKEPRVRARALYLRAVLMVDRNRIADARTTLTDIRKNYSGTSAEIDAAFILANLSVSDGDIEKALTILKEVAASRGATSAQRQRAWVEAGHAAASATRLTEAADAFEKGASIDGPLTASAAYNAGRILEMGGNREKASRLYERGAMDSSRTPDRIDRLIGGVKAGRWMGRMDLLARFAGRIRNEYPGDRAVPRVLQWWGEEEVERGGDLDRAEETFRSVLRHPESAPVADRALRGLAKCLAGSGNGEEALATYDELLRRYPASRFRDEVAADREQVRIFLVRDRDAGVEQLALLLADVIGEQSKSTLSFRLAEISFLQLKNFTLARDQYRTALEEGLNGTSRPTAWMHLGRASEYLALRLARNSAEWLGHIQDAKSAYDRLIVEHAEHPLAADAMAALTALNSALILDGAGLERDAGRADSLRPAGPVASAIRLTLARRAAELGLKERAAGWYSEALQASREQSVRGEILYRSGLLYAGSGSADTARSLFAASFRDNGVHPFVVAAGMELARIESGRGNVSAVRDIRTRLLPAFEYAVSESELLLLQGEASFASGQFEQSFGLFGEYRRRVESDPFTPKLPETEVIFKMARSAQETGRSQDALKLFGEVVGRVPEAAIMLASYNAIATLSESLGDISRASAAMQEASAIAARAGGNVESISLQSADLLFRNEQYQQALARYTDIQKGTPSDSLRNALEARVIVCLFRMDNLKEADRRATTFVRANSAGKAEAAEFEFERARHHVRQGKLNEARGRFEIVVRQYPDVRLVPEALFWLGRTYELAQLPDSAAVVYADLLRRYPENEIAPRVELSLGNAYYTLEQWDKAAPLFKTLVDNPERAPDLVQYAMNNLILTYKELALFDGALQLTRTYIESYPEDPDLINKRIDIGVLYQRLGYFDQSAVHLQDLLLTAPSEFEAELRYYIGEAYYYKAEYQQAILEFLKVPYLVIRHGPIDWVATSYYMAGQSYEKMSRFDQAVAMYRQIIERPGIDAQFKTAAQREIDRVNQLVKQR